MRIKLILSLVVTTFLVLKSNYTQENNQISKLGIDCPFEIEIDEIPKCEVYRVSRYSVYGLSKKELKKHMKKSIYTNSLSSIRSLEFEYVCEFFSDLTKNIEFELKKIIVQNDAMREDIIILEIHYLSKKKRHSSCP